MYNRRFITLNGLKWCVRWNSVRLVLPDSRHCRWIGGTLLMTSPRRRLSMKCAQSTVIYPRDAEYGDWGPTAFGSLSAMSSSLHSARSEWIPPNTPEKQKDKNRCATVLCTLTFAMISCTMLLLVHSGYLDEVCALGSMASSHSVNHACDVD